MVAARVLKPKIENGDPIGPNGDPKTLETCDLSYIYESSKLYKFIFTIQIEISMTCLLVGADGKENTLTRWHIGNFAPVDLHRHMMGFQ